MQLLKLAVAVAVAGAAWISQASYALGGGPASERFALLPLGFPALGAAAIAGAATAAILLRGGSLAPFAVIGLLALPWLPGRVPAGFLLWTPPLALVVWVALAVVLLACVRRPPAARPARPVLVATTIAFCLHAIAGWSVKPSLPGGDEPHYLIIAQSLLHDQDLRIENNHQRSDYRPYFAGDLPPHFLKRGQDGEIYSVHAPGLPALVAPAFAAGGHPAVMVFLMLLAALGSGLAWHLAWLRTRSDAAAWFGWAAVTCAPTTVFHSFTVYPDGVAGIVVLTGVWGLMRASAADATRATRLHWALHGAALALLPWLHSRFAVLAGALGVLILLHLAGRPRRIQHALAFLAAPGVSCAGWLAYFALIYGEANPAAPYGGEIGSAAYIADGLAGLLFDQRFGLFAYAPVLLFAPAGLLVMLRARPAGPPLSGGRRLAIELLLVALPYLLVVTAFRMWWGGWSAPARFAAPLVLMLAIPLAEVWLAIRRRATRATALAALIFTVYATGVLVVVDAGRLAYNVRTAPAEWIGWLSRNAALTEALPAWSDRHGEFFQDIAVWCGVMLLAWLLLRTIERGASLRDRQAFGAATVLLYASAAMVAATSVWTLHGHDGRQPLRAQMDLLRAAGSESGLAVALDPPRLLAPSELPGKLRIRPPLIPLPQGADPSGSLLFAVPAVPAGEYRIRPHARGVRGHLTIEVGRDGPALRSIAIADTRDGVLLRLPVEVRGLFVRGDEQARRDVRGLTIEPLTVAPERERSTSAFAVHAVGYPPGSAFFLDDGSFPEPDGFWVRGGRESTVVLQPGVGSDSVVLQLHNAPVRNQVRLETAGHTENFDLEPGEERTVHVPMDRARGVAVIRVSASSGFRPSELDANNRDHRYLGVRITWVTASSTGLGARSATTRSRTATRRPPE